MEIVGKIFKVLDVQTGQGKNGVWKKQEFVIETGDTYPKKIMFAVWGDKINTAALQPGQDVKVSIDIESREYNNRWYTDVKAWKIEMGGDSGNNAMPANAAMPDNTTFTDPNFASNSVDDLPF